jgi:WD40 repeat protein
MLPLYTVAQDPQLFIHSIDWSDDGSHFAVTTHEGLSIYDALLNPVAVYTFPPDLSTVPVIDFSPDGSRIFVGSTRPAQGFAAGNRIADGIWDTTTLQPMVDLDHDDILFFTSQWSSDGTMIAFRSRDDRGTNIYSAEDGELLRSFSSMNWQVGAEIGPRWSPDNSRFATLSGRDGLLILDAVTGDDIGRYPMPVTRIDSISWSPDSTQLALVTITDAAIGSPESIPTGESGKAALVAVLVVDTETGRVVNSISGIPTGILSIAWSPDGKQLAGNTTDGAVLVWDAEQGTLIDGYRVAPYRVKLLQYSPYSGRILIGFNPGEPFSSSSETALTTPSYQQTMLDGVLQFIVPAPSLDRLASVQAACGAQPDIGTLLPVPDRTADLDTYVTQIESAPDDAIPPGCKADLLAVAAALAAQAGGP